MGSLPDQEQTNLGFLGAANSQLEAITQAISQAQQEKAMDESFLDSQLGNWKAIKSGGTAPETLDEQLKALQEQLAVLESRYTPEHPDVIKAKHQIEQLKKRIAEMPKATVTTTTSVTGEIEPPAIQQLRARLKQDDLKIADLTKRQSQIQNQIAILQGRLQLSPAVEQQYKQLTRDHQSAVDYYNDLLRRSNQAGIARNLNQRQEGEQFSIEDSPSLPMTPSFPKKVNFAGGGLGGGLFLGLAVLYLLAALDPSMHSEQDVEACLKLPVLALVPTVDAAGLGGVKSNGKSTEMNLVGNPH